MCLERSHLRQYPPPPIVPQNIENKWQEKFALRKIFHLNELDIKIFIRKDLRIRNSGPYEAKMEDVICKRVTQSARQEADPVRISCFSTGERRWFSVN
jgi:hypothetical protein